MKPYILDASVAIKWFLDEDIGKSEALQVLDSVRSDPRHYIVPELFFNEMLSVFVRITKKAEITLDYMNILQDLGFERVGNGRKLLETAAQIATEYHLSGYDAIYASTAKLTGGIWLTADKNAHHKITRLKISELL